MLSAEKQKNDNKIALSITLERVRCGVDSEGEAVYSLAVASDSGAAVAPHNDNQSGCQSLSPVGERVLAVLREAGVEGLDALEWRKRAQAAGIGPERPATAHEWIKKLVARGFVEARPDGTHIVRE